jgi:6-phosphogluconate dehydrogenase
MKIGLIGLGRMGLSITQRLLQAKYEVYGFDADQSAVKNAKALGVVCVKSLKELCASVRVFWLMLPAGEIIDKVLNELVIDLKAGDVIIDGGNSHFKDSIRRGRALNEMQVCFLDCGTSGGLKGKEIGFCLMVGGDNSSYKKAEQIFKAIASPCGYAHVGPLGAGHYVKMVHNGIEYALMQSYAEGFHLLKDGHFKDLDLAKISGIWSNGAVIRSWLLELTHEILEQDQQLKNISGAVGENKTGFWTVEEAQVYNIPVDLIERALQIRAWSRESGGNYATKIVSMMRNKFGGHEVVKNENC